MPSKKIIILILVALVLVGITFGVLKHYSPDTYVAPSANIIKNQPEVIAAQLNEIDSDKDGLKDWEEVLWKTDPHKADTDNDGTPDGQEVKDGRDPTMAGPNDKIKQETIDKKISSSANADVTFDPNNLTDSAARDLFTKYMTVKQSGAPLSADLKNAMVEGVMKTATSKNLTMKIYSATDIHVIGDSSESALRNYANTAGESMKKSYVSGDSELTILSNTVSNNDNSQLEKLTPIIKGYKQSLKDLLAIPVPARLLSIHLQMINSISEVETKIEAFQYFTTDPIRAGMGISTYEASVNKMADAFKAVADFYAQQGITFTVNESGYVLTNTGM